MSYTEQLERFKAEVYKPLNYTKFAAFDLIEKGLVLSDDSHTYNILSLQKINSNWYVMHMDLADKYKYEYKELFEEMPIELQCQIMDSIKTV